MYEKIAQQ